MLAPLDNETIFKKAFTDKDVFVQFVKDILDIDFDKKKKKPSFEPYKFLCCIGASGDVTLK